MIKPPVPSLGQATKMEIGRTTQDKNASMTIITKLMVKPSNSIEQITS